jgi:hypothetical protein
VRRAERSTRAGPRLFELPQARARRGRGVDETGPPARLVVSHDGYRRLAGSPVHRRTFELDRRQDGFRARRRRRARRPPPSSRAAISRRGRGDGDRRCGRGARTRRRTRTVEFRNARVEVARRGSRAEFGVRERAPRLVARCAGRCRSTSGTRSPTAARRAARDEAARAAGATREPRAVRRLRRGRLDLPSTRACGSRRARSPRRVPRRGARLPVRHPELQRADGAIDVSRSPFGYGPSPSRRETRARRAAPLAGDPPHARRVYHSHDVHVGPPSWVASACAGRRSSSTRTRSTGGGTRAAARRAPARWPRRRAARALHGPPQATS